MCTLSIKKSVYGVLCDGTEASLYTVSNGKMSFSATDYGCTLTSIILPGKNGKNVDILIGPSTLDGCVRDDKSFGTVVGRFANRIGNACFTLDGKTYNLDKNDGNNCLHGGFDRYEKKLWTSREVETPSGKGIEFTRFSPDGEQGMPGNLKVKVVYTLNDKNELTLDYSAESDAPTPVNLTNHAYFNLKGYNGGAIEDQELQLDSSSFVEVSDALIPTGKYSSVDDNPAYDFRKAKLLGKDIAKTGVGYDHAFCVDGFDGSLKKFALLKDPASGRSMSVATTLPACQVYTANYIEGFVGKNGYVHKRHDAVCLETESCPDTPNQKNFPSCIVTPDKPYHEVTVYGFDF
ncbi:MAG: galactose mutarotase [Treponema sp.]|nr:galactose mutarotase [Treponema sp.]